MPTPLQSGPRRPGSATPVPLDPAQAAQVLGAGGDLNLAIQTPPLRGTLDLSYAGERARIGASLGFSADAWMGGLNAGVQLGRARLDGSYRTDGQTWEARVGLRIPLGTH